MTVTRDTSSHPRMASLLANARRLCRARHKRHTFGTMLSKAGVPLQLIQKAMRHSDPRLTMGTYSQLELLDLSGAVAERPDFTSPDKALQKMTANSERSVALSVALFPVKARESLASAGTSAHSSAKALVPDNGDVGVTPDMSCERVTSGNTTTEWWAVQDLNLRPSACKAIQTGYSGISPDTENIMECLSSLTDMRYPLDACCIPWYTPVGIRAGYERKQRL